MKRLTLLTIAALLAIGGAFNVFAAEESDVVGTWATTPTERGYAKVKVSDEGGKYFGEIIWLSKPTYDASEGPELEGKKKEDRKNPDKAQQHRPIIGIRIVKDMEYKGDGLWEGGTIYDPENGKTYKAKMTLEGDTLNVRGFIGFSLLGRTTEWTRIKDEPMDKGMDKEMDKDKEMGMEMDKGEPSGG